MSISVMSGFTASMQLQRLLAVHRHSDNLDARTFERVGGSDDELWAVVDNDAPQGLYLQCHVPSVGTSHVGAIPASCTVARRPVGARAGW